MVFNTLRRRLGIGADHREIIKINSDEKGIFRVTRRLSPFSSAVIGAKQVCDLAVDVKGFIGHCRVY